MPDDRKPSPLELGLYARAEAEPRITLIEIVAGALTLVWLLAVLFFGVGGAEDGGSGGAGGLARSVLAVLAVLLPVALIWVAAVAARTARSLRQEASRLQASIDAMRIAYVEQQQNAALNIKPELLRRFEELLAAQGVAEAGRPATFTSLRALAPPETRAAMVEAADATDADVPQPSLAFAQPDPREPISVAEFIKALNFPENEHDKEGFRTLAPCAGGSGHGAPDPRQPGRADPDEPGRHLHGRPAARPLAPRDMAAFSRRANAGGLSRGWAASMTGLPSCLRPGG